MFHRHYRLYASMLYLGDALSGLPALYGAYSLRSYLVRFAPEGLAVYFNPQLLPFRDYLFCYLIFLPVWSLLLGITQRYSNVLQFPLLVQFGRALQFLVLTGVSGAFLFFTFQLQISRPVFFVFLILAGVWLGIERLLLQWLLRSRNTSEHTQIKLLIVGTDRGARRIGKALEQYEKWGYHVVGYVAYGPEHANDRDLNVLGVLDELPQLLNESIVVDEVLFVGSQTKDLTTLEETIRLCEDLGIRTHLVADFFPISISKLSLEYLGDLPLITLSAVPDHALSVAAKRVLDCTIGLFLLILLSPLFLFLAILVKATTKGPVFYRQTRCGLYGRKFTLIKFRTMIQGAEDRLWEIKHLNEMGGPVFKMRNDPRVTRVGRWLRKSSLDELPQLWNVIKGEMSLVGPRAPLPEEVRHYSSKQRRRLSVKPGITCLWQVSGRNDINFDEWMELDLQYIDNWSFWLDMRIILKTIPVVFTGKGAR
ncbi:MAG: sugar transferase [Acidobacteria bacterium]|nr:sugar transferase [Acidobacteriota bacterium]